MVQGGGRNLVVVKNTLLELYQLRVQSENTEENAIFHARLELRHSAALFGKVAQMAVVRPTGAATDRLLLAFDTGNLAIVAWDPVKFDFTKLRFSFEFPRNASCRNLLHGDAMGMSRDDSSGTSGAYRPLMRSCCTS